MADIQVFPSCVALLGDLVSSRSGDRAQSHEAVLAAIEETNANVPQLDALRVTVGDELQGVYASLGDAFRASLELRNRLAGTVDVRFGFGGGKVRILDEARGIQDGPAWSLAREAIDAAKALAAEPGRQGLRTAVRDGRDVANPLTEPLSQLIDTHLGRLRARPRATFTALWDGLDNQTTAHLLGITPSANSQRVTGNQLRSLLTAARALAALP